MSGFEIAGAVLGAAGLILPLIGAADRAGKQIRSFKENKKDIDEILDGLTLLHARLQSVRSQLTSPGCELRPANAQRLVQHLTEAEALFSRAMLSSKSFARSAEPVVS
jgi:hypothetical protein